MPTIKYKIKDEVVPSVTTITSRFKDSGAITGWSNKLGLKGITYYEELQRTANIGSTFHDQVENYINKKDFVPSDVEEVQNCYSKFLVWWEKYHG
tara:strand:+ start:35 stop:319 length:285 start_codon:yes stop_codon:yes gene_type:complete